jgi:hypothetical protein
VEELESVQKGLAIIGSGFGRTGTMSLKRALEQLGFGPCHHMEEVLAHPEQVPHWQAAAAGQSVDWENVFAGYRSQVDWPGAHVWRQLAATYPQAKLIHTVRPEEQWWKSFSGTIAVLLSSPSQMPLPAHMRNMMEIARSIMMQTFGDHWTDREAALAGYRDRTAQVRDAIRPERLLVFDVADGWEPLCEFLGVPTPDTTFPHLNSTEEWWKLVKSVMQ